MSSNRRTLLVTGFALACGDALAQQGGTPQQTPPPTGSAARPTEDATRGPFGLAWGSSTDQVKEMEVQLTPSSGNNWGTSFTAAGLSQVLHDAELVLLSFGHRNRLWRVAAAGRTISREPYGASTIARYQELSQALSSRYGAGRESDHRDTRIWNEPNQYVMSLHQGRAHRYTTFETPSTHIELSMRAAGGDSSYWFLIYASKAERALFEQDKRSRETNSL